VGEAVVTAPESIVVDGPLAGRTLDELVRADPASVLGSRGLKVTGGRPLFPLLVKLIDAAQNLSIQVHPDDAAAAPLNRLGKTEAYHVLEADPGGVIGLGLRPDVTPEAFVAACRAAGGGADDLVRWIPAVPGTTFLIPAGTVHALGAGCVVYEVQQPSDITYRFHDGGRVDASGRSRELHIDQGAAVLDAAFRPEAISPLSLDSATGRRDLLAACHHFALERVALTAGDAVMVRADGSPQALTCLAGTVEVTSPARIASIAPGQTAIVGAGSEGVVAAVEAAVILRAWVPDLEAEVVAPARASGARDPDIAALSGPLPDLRRLL
jgi:mannose-6-phosphate isomerase